MVLMPLALLYIQRGDQRSLPAKPDIQRGHQRSLPAKLAVLQP